MSARFDCKDGRSEKGSLWGFLVVSWGFSGSGDETEAPLPGEVVTGEDGLYAALGQVDRAFEWFGKAVEERSSGLIYLDVEPQLDILRHDPRFSELRSASACLVPRGRMLWRPP